MPVPIRQNDYATKPECARDTPNIRAAPPAISIHLANTVGGPREAAVACQSPALTDAASVPAEA
eukprot:13784183-Alexandrium_andersonii.AAC.1